MKNSNDDQSQEQMPARPNTAWQDRPASPVLRRSLKSLHAVLLLLHSWVRGHPRWTIVILLTTLATSLVWLPHLRVLMSIDDLADADFATYAQLKDVKSRFLDQDEIFVVIRRDDGRPPDKANLCAIQKWIQVTSDTRGDIRAVVSTLGVLWPTETTTSFQASPLLHPDCIDLHRDQEAELSRGYAAIRESPWGGTLTSRAGDDVAIVLFPAARRTSGFFGTFNSRTVTDLQSSLNDALTQSSPHLHASWAGDGIFQFHLQKGYEAMPRLNLLMSWIVILLFRIFFGTFRSSFIFLQLVVWVTLPVYGLMAYFGHPIDVLSSSLSLMFFVSSLEDFVFVSHFIGERGWSHAFRRVLIPCFFTSLTTVIGFGSLIFADLGIIRRFGLWAAVGAALEWVVLFLVLPAFLQLIPSLRTWVIQERAWQPKLPWLLQIRPGRWMTRFAMLILPLGLWASGHLHVSDSPERLLPENSIPRRDLGLIEKTRGWRAEVSLVFKDADDETFNQSVLDRVSAWPLVSQIEDVYKVRKFMTSRLSPPMRSYMTELIEQNTVGHRLGPSGGETRAILYLKALDIVEVNQMRHDVARLCPHSECWLGGSLVTYGELSERVLSTLYSSLGISLLLVLAILAYLSFGLRPQAFLPLAVSSLWGPAALLLTFAVFKIPVFYVTSMIAAIIVGLAGDNAIQFLFFAGRATHGSRRGLQSSVSRIGAAAFIVAFCMILSSTAFFFGYFDPMRLLGLMMIIGLALAFLGDVCILRGLAGDESRGVDSHDATL